MTPPWHRAPGVRRFGREHLDVFATPGAFTDLDDAGDLGGFAARGGRWIAYQTVNGDNDVRSFDLGPARRAGLSPGVWGVTYEAGKFARDAERLARSAASLGADFLIVDAEECLKNRTEGEIRALVGALAPFRGPKALSTLGAPVNPAVNTYPIPLRPFLEAGFSVLPQAYVNDHAEYAPDACVFYWQRVGFPRDRINVTISLVAGDTSHVRLSGGEWKPHLERARIAPAVSLFMLQHATPDDLGALEPLLRFAPPPPPPPPHVTTAGEVRARMVALAREQEARWAAGGMSPDKVAEQRIAIARRLLEVPDAQWPELRQAVRDALDASPS